MQEQRLFKKKKILPNDMTKNEAKTNTNTESNEFLSRYTSIKSQPRFLPIEIHFPI